MISCCELSVRRRSLLILRNYRTVNLQNKKKLLRQDNWPSFGKAERGISSNERGMLTNKLCT